MVGEEHPCQYKQTSTVLKGNKTNEKGMNSFLCMGLDPLIKCRSVVDDRNSFFMKIYSWESHNYHFTTGPSCSKGG